MTALMSFILAAYIICCVLFSVGFIIMGLVDHFAQRLKG